MVRVFGQWSLDWIRREGRPGTVMDNERTVESMDGRTVRNRIVGLGVTIVEKVTDNGQGRMLACDF